MRRFSQSGSDTVIYRVKTGTNIMLVLIYLRIIGWCSVWAVGVLLSWSFDKSFLRNDLNLNMGHNHMHGNNMHSGMNMSTTPPMTHGDHGGHGSTVHHMMQVCIGCLVSFVYYFILKTASFQSEICHCSHF